MGRAQTPAPEGFVRLMSTRPHRRFVLTAAVLPALLLALVTGQTQSSATTSADNPLAAQPWGVYTGGADGLYPAWQAATGNQKALLAKSALQPRVRWFGSWIPAHDIAAKLGDYITTTQREAGTKDVLIQLAQFMLWPNGEVAYKNPLPDGYPAYYRGWVDKAAATIGDARVVLVLEPDLGITQKDGAWKPSARLDLVAYAAQVFGALPRTTVYLDASSADWLRVDVARDMLLAAGVENVRGFALGATHYTALGDELTYGRQLVAALADAGVPGKHYVVDTADNGKPFTWPEYWAKHPDGDFNNAETCTTSTEDKCDTLGIPPTSRVASDAWGLTTGQRRAARRWCDAYLWFGRPWLYRQASPFDLQRALAIGRTTPW